ncbi:TonB family protein [Pontibacter sp. Tf4]|uniref:TonB family protein n=1 Tax=Pontibacter sp. Tf4 TaxID=2761620 RepID=UPI0016296833|nr:TonB family protein [Pontibacter sp. Tf4]MBB6610681.1 TonB family protein [Pontibacter sp. Tf4]
MNHANRHILFGADGHPTMELLRQYQEGLLSPALSHQLERHLLDCELCADIVEGMTLSNATQTKAAITDIKQRMAVKEEKRRAAAWYSDWRAVAAVLVLFCSALMVFYYQYTNLQTAPETIAAEQTETINQQPEPTINYAPPIAKLDEEAAEEPKADQPIVKQRPKFSEPIVVADQQDDFMADEEVFPEETIAAVTETEVAEGIALEEITFDLKQDSVATIATAKPKTRAATTPQMNLERALQGQAAGVSIQRNALNGNVAKGKVTDDNGIPLPGVTVQVKGTMLGVSTDKDGNFTIPLPESKNTLTFRYIGFETKEQKIDSATQLLAINLQPDNQALSEVVVTGYSKRAAEESADVPVIEKPNPTIGQRAYKLYLKNEQRPLTEKVKGRVIVGFTVSEKGQLEHVRVLRSLNPEADAEAIRLIKDGPAWEPAMQNGNRVAQQVKVVVRFR